MLNGDTLLLSFSNYGFWNPVLTGFLYVLKPLALADGFFMIDVGTLSSTLRFAEVPLDFDFVGF